MKSKKYFKSSAFILRNDKLCVFLHFCTRVFTAEGSEIIHYINNEPTQLVRKRAKPFCGQNSLTGKFSKSMMTFSVQSSPSLSLRSASVCLSIAAFCEVSCSICAVTSLRVALCSLSFVLTDKGGEEETDDRSGDRSITW